MQAIFDAPGELGGLAIARRMTYRLECLPALGINTPTNVFCHCWPSVAVLIDPGHIQR